MFFSLTQICSGSSLQDWSTKEKPRSVGLGDFILQNLDVHNWHFISKITQLMEFINMDPLGIKLDLHWDVYRFLQS